MSEYARYLQGLLGRAARLLLELPGLEGLNVLVTLPVAAVQKVLLGLQQALARGHVADPDGEAPVGWSGIKEGYKKDCLVRRGAQTTIGCRDLAV